MEAERYQELQQASVDVAEEIVNEPVDNNRPPPLPVAGRTRRRSAVKRNLRVPTLQQMEVLEPQQFVVSIPDEQNPDIEWDVVVQELSPGQYALLQDTAFTRNAAAARVKIDSLNIDPDSEDPEDQAKVREILNSDETRNTIQEFEEYKVEVCLLGIVEPMGLTREIISRWSSNNIERIYEAIMQGATAVDAVDAFPSEDQ